MPSCPYPACDAPLTLCNLGHALGECPHWLDAKPSTTGVESPATEPVLPWLGGSLGHLDLDFVTSRSRSRLMGIVGPHDAGKTTLLSILYLLLWRGRALSRGSFGGSYTLGGWEGLAHALRWQPGQPPHFPPHTSRAPGRTSGLLHLALRRPDTRLEDLLFTDAPGEWFESWALDRAAPAAEGARWTFRHGSAFALVVDSGALSGPQRGEARGKIVSLARRIGDVLDGRRVAVVWSKSDRAVSDEIRTRLQAVFESTLPGHQEFSVSVYPPAGEKEPDVQVYLRLFDWLLEVPERRAVSPIPTPAESSDPFLAFRGAR